MNKNTENSQNNDFPIGEILSESRIKAGLSESDVADKLNLNTEIIVAIENDQFEAGLSPAFYRGYIRSYACLLQLDADDLVGNYNKNTHSDSFSSHITPTFDHNLSSQMALKKSFLKSKIIIITALAAIAIITYLLVIKSSTNPPADEPKIESKTLETDAATGDNAIPLNVEENDAKTTSMTNKDQRNNKDEKINKEQLVQKPDKSQSVIKDNKQKLAMTFSGECWVKVIDAAGNELAYGIKKAGKSMLLYGIAPFQVVLGDPSVVQMSLDGQEVELSGYPSGKRLKLSVDSIE